MFTPRAGKSLNRLLERVEPQSGVKSVAFTPLRNEAVISPQNTDTLERFYAETPPIDEAIHPLTPLTAGLHE